ncbi:hypothetical protein [Lysinibacillus fusiformis]|uniref:hypothetical protein n=1 Tax=Lysinibacillus fusiformis TaxID=28031 RepID=UPI001EF74CB1|nr:hypothetical protein [Lysinibacillus fusiformis]MCG7437290.1 hypothetical protein [Lysinibacillus fusiformis]
MIKHTKIQNVDYFKTYLTLVMELREYTLQEAIDFMVKTYFCNRIELYGLKTKQQFEKAIQQLSVKKIDCHSDSNSRFRL